MNDLAEKLTSYDPAEDLTSGKAIAAFVAEAFETKNVGYIARALGVVARAADPNSGESADAGLR